MDNIAISSEDGLRINSSAAPSLFPSIQNKPAYQTGSNLEPSILGFLNELRGTSQNVRKEKTEKELLSLYDDYKVCTNQETETVPPGNITLAAEAGGALEIDSTIHTNVATTSLQNVYNENGSSTLEIPPPTDASEVMADNNKSRSTLEKEGSSELLQTNDEPVFQALQQIDQQIKDINNSLQNAAAQEKSETENLLSEILGATLMSFLETSAAGTPLGATLLVAGSSALMTTSSLGKEIMNELTSSLLESKNLSSTQAEILADAFLIISTVIISGGTTDGIVTLEKEAALHDEKSPNIINATLHQWAQAVLETEPNGLKTTGSLKKLISVGTDIITSLTTSSQGNSASSSKKVTTNNLHSQNLHHLTNYLNEGLNIAGSLFEERPYDRMQLVEKF